MLLSECQADLMSLGGENADSGRRGRPRRLTGTDREEDFMGTIRDRIDPRVTQLLGSLGMNVGREHIESADTSDLAADQNSKVQDVLLSVFDRTALADGFRPLETVKPSLPDRLLRYVVEGKDEEVLSKLLNTPNAADLLGIDLSFYGTPPSPRMTPSPAWDALLEHSTSVPVPVLLRFAKVLFAALGPQSLIRCEKQGDTVYDPLPSFLEPLSPPPWLELMVRLGVTEMEHASNAYPIYRNRIPAEIIERMLQADEYSPELIYSKALPPSERDGLFSNPLMMLIGGLAGFGEQLAKRPEMITAALRGGTGDQASPGTGGIRANWPFRSSLSLMTWPGWQPGQQRSSAKMSSPFVAQAGAAALPALARSRRPASPTNAVMPCA